MYYHGTTSNVVDSILKYGLRPTPANKWHIAIKGFGVFGADYRPDEEDDNVSIYLCNNPLRAGAWAYAKAQYLRTLPGRHFKAIGFHGDMVKDTDAPLIKDVKPIILRVTWNGIVQPDPKTPDDYGNNVFTTESIPARFLSVIRFPTLKQIQSLF